MADRYRIRPAELADLPQIAAIERNVFSDPWSPAMLQSALHAVALVTVDVNGSVLGYLFAIPMVDDGEILNLAVHPGCRRRGVATALTEAGCSALFQRGVRRVFLEVRASNEGAQRFYAAMGFQQVGRRHDYYRRPREDALLMVRHLRRERGSRRTGQNGVSLIDKRT